MPMYLNQDADLRLQAKPGYGIPSQDPSPEAQILMSEAEQSKELTSSFSGTGLLTGATLAASIGSVLAGIDGLVLGAMLGAIGGMSIGFSMATQLLRKSNSLLKL